MKQQTRFLSILLTLTVFTASGCGIMFSQSDHNDQEFLQDEDEQPQTKTESPVLRKPVNKYQALEAKVTACTYDLDLSEYTFPKTTGCWLSPPRHQYALEVQGRERIFLCLMDQKCRAAEHKKPNHGDHERCIQHNRCCDITPD